MTGRSGKVFKAHFKPLRPVLTSPARITASASTTGGVKGSNSRCKSLRMWRRMGFWSVGPHSYTPSQFTFLLDANGHGQKSLDYPRIRGRVQGRLGGPKRATTRQRHRYQERKNQRRTGAHADRFP